MECSETIHQNQVSPQQSSQDEVQKWIEGMLTLKFTSDFHSFLKDGLVLCKLMNKVVPGSISRVHRSSKPAFQRENITFFIRALRDFGVAEQDNFDTNDLYEAKNLSAVCKGLFAFGRAIQSKMSEFQGPVLGKKEASRRSIEFDPSMIEAARNEPTRITQGSYLLRPGN